jgi:hypothetical protein
LKDVDSSWQKDSHNGRDLWQVRLCREREHYNCESVVVESDGGLRF